MIQLGSRVSNLDGTAFGEVTQAYQEAGVVVMAMVVWDEDQQRRPMRVNANQLVER